MNNNNNGELEGGLKDMGWGGGGGLIIFLPLKRGAYKRGGLFEGGGWGNLIEDLRY